MRALLTILAFVALSASPALAQDWRAIEVSGAVRVMTPGEPARAVREQDVLPVGAVVTTGRDGRAVFSDGAARATLGANSRLTLAPSASGFTRFVQDLGAVLFQVDRRADVHFEVRTSLVAAVVKGTTFTVSVEPDQHRVFVAEGMVEVSPAAGGEAELVSGGGIAQVERDAPGRVERPESSQQRGAAVAPALDYAALSGGLVGGRQGDGYEDMGDNAASAADTIELALADVGAAAAADQSGDDDSGSDGDSGGEDDESGFGDDDDGSDGGNDGDGDSGGGGDDGDDDDDGDDGDDEDDDDDDDGGDD